MCSLNVLARTHIPSVKNEVYPAFPAHNRLPCKITSAHTYHVAALNQAFLELSGPLCPRYAALGAEVFILCGESRMEYGCMGGGGYDVPSASTAHMTAMWTATSRCPPCGRLNLVSAPAT
jgi:hypothetical protein